jgi:Ni/Fe-hydrogenase subunit HybB-like protein
METLLTAVPSIYLLAGGHWRITSHLFLADVLIAVGGMLYRFDPTSFAFVSRPGAVYFPSATEALIAAGAVCFALAAFILAVKYLPILPAPVTAWHDLAEYAGAVHGNWRLKTHDFSYQNRPDFAD